MAVIINVAIVGLGFGAEFIPIYQRHPHAKMYAICQRDPKKLDTMRVEIEFANKYPVRLLCDEPDKAALSK
jgi:predicted dehydrogenase